MSSCARILPICSRTCAALSMAHGSDPSAPASRRGGGQLIIHGAGHRRLHDRQLDPEQIDQTAVRPHRRIPGFDRHLLLLASTAKAAGRSLMWRRRPFAHAEPTSGRCRRAHGGLPLSTRAAIRPILALEPFDRLIAKAGKPEWSRSGSPVPRPRWRQRCCGPSARHTGRPDGRAGRSRSLSPLRRAAAPTSLAVCWRPSLPPPSGSNSSSRTGRAIAAPSARRRSHGQRPTAIRC